MIDTIRLKIPLNEELRKGLVKQSVHAKKQSVEGRVIFYSNFVVPVSLPSWDYHINIFFREFDSNSFYIEFSVPKFIFGHNLYMVYPDELFDIMGDFYVYLSRTLEVVLPEINKWEVVRCDFCYSWRFRNDDQARAIMATLQTFRYPRQKKLSTIPLL